MYRTVWLNWKERVKNNMAVTILICFLAGIGAGLGTGFAGMSASAVITPMLVILLKMDAYQAVGIALASDVLASGISAYTYGKNKNLDIKNGSVMMGMVLLFTVIFSYLSSLLPSAALGNTAAYILPIMGLKFVIKPVVTTKEQMTETPPRKRLIQSILGGALIGSICGFVGAGGGMMMLLILTSVLHYEIKMAVGTSVFIMTFTALTGAVSHFAIGGMPDLIPLVVCILSTLLWARVAALIANKVSAEKLNRTLGIVLMILGVAMLVFQWFF